MKMALFSTPVSYPLGSAESLKAGLFRHIAGKTALISANNLAGVGKTPNRLPTPRQRWAA